MKKITILCVAGLLCLFLRAEGQEALSPGTVVPDIVFNNLLHYPHSSAKLSDFRGKLVILDFWATWCRSCINHLPEIDSLQNDFSGRLQVLLVNSTNTGDSPGKVSSFLSKWESNHKPLGLAIASGDSLTQKYFPRTFLPHYVWIDAGGRYLGATTWDAVNRDNILSALQGRYNLPSKKD